MNETMNEAIKVLLRKKIVPAVLSIAMGIALILARRAAVDVIVKIFGGLMIAGGIGFVALSFTGPNKNKYDRSVALSMAAIIIIIGILFILFAEAIVDFFPIMMGIVLILNGLSNLSAAFTNSENRILIGLMSAVVIAFGVLILMRPGVMADALTIYIGVFFILNGIFDLFMLRRIKNTLM